MGRRERRGDGGGAAVLRPSRHEGPAPRPAAPLRCRVTRPAVEPPSATDALITHIVPRAPLVIVVMYQCIDAGINLIARRRRRRGIVGAAARRLCHR